MRAVHFGAGNIGRGFVGALLSRSGYEVCFVDIQPSLVDALRERGAYTVRLLGDVEEKIDVNHVTALNSKTEPERVIEAIAGADVVTTAVGPNVLKGVAPLLADGLRLRLQKGGHPLNVIACENMLGGSSLLKTLVTAEMTDEERQEMDSRIGFPDAAVDRIVPEQKGSDLLEVAVEPYYEWVVDLRGAKGDVPSIEGVTYVEGLAPYIERKLFTVNTGHAVCAYLGYLRGYATVQEAIADSTVRETVRGVLKETGQLLVQKYGFDPKDHRKYIEKHSDAIPKSSSDRSGEPGRPLSDSEVGSGRPLAGTCSPDPGAWDLARPSRYRHRRRPPICRCGGSGSGGVATAHQRRGSDRSAGKDR